MIYLTITIVSIIASIVIGTMIIRNFSTPSEKHFSKPEDVDPNVEEVSIATKNNKHLYGWCLSAEEKASTIILMHGWGRNISRLIPYIKNLQGKGYNLLAFDSRHHGNSDPDKFSSMVKFAEDISASIDYIKNKPFSNNEIYLVGLSIGGAASIYAAAHDLRITKIVTVGAPSNPAQVMKMHMRKKHIPMPIIWVAFKIMEYRIGKSFTELSSENNISKTEAKVLLIHGKNDKVVPFSQAKLIMEGANRNQASLWTIEGKGHSNCHYEEGFWNNIIEFLDT